MIKLARRTNINDLYLGEDWYIPFSFKPVINVSSFGLSFYLLASEDDALPIFERTKAAGHIVLLTNSTGYTFIPRSLTTPPALTRRAYFWKMARTDADNVKLYGFGTIDLLYDTD